MENENVVELGPFPGTRSPYTNRLVEMFAKTSPGDIVTHDEICAHLNAPRDGWRGLMETVKRDLRRKHRVVLETIPKKGYRHALDVDLSGLTRRKMRGVRRQMESALERHHAVKAFAELPDGARREHAIQGAGIAGVLLASGLDAERANRVRINAAPAPFASDDVLRLLNGRKKT